MRPLSWVCIVLQRMQQVWVQQLGYKHYAPVWAMQEQLLAQAVQTKAEQASLLPVARTTRHHLLLVEHPPVYTLGKSGHVENILISAEQMQQMGIEYYKINRGGDITFHGPGQLVGYPILDLEKFYTDIGRYLRALEEVIIRTMAAFGLQGMRSPGETGVWLQADQPGFERKICAMGVRCSRWVTMHGWALNVNTNLDYFNHIIPCGIQNKKVTSLQQELGRPVPMELVTEKLLEAFAEVFEVQIMREATMDPLLQTTPLPANA